MTGLVVVTHDGIGETIRHQAETILGHPVGLTTIAITGQTDPDSGLEQLHAALAMSADNGGVLVLTDLPGATPHNLAQRAAGDRQAPVVSGLNLSMLLKVINHVDQPAATLAELAVDGGQRGITLA